MDIIENILRKRLDNDIVYNIMMIIWKEEHKSKFIKMLRNDIHHPIGTFKNTRFTTNCSQDSCQKSIHKSEHFDFCVNEHHEREHNILINDDIVFSYRYKYSKKNQSYKIVHAKGKVVEYYGCCVMDEMDEYREFIR